MTYHQVADLGLLSSYFEALGIDGIKDLITGIGVPPSNNLQVALMHLKWAQGTDDINSRATMYTLHSPELPIITTSCIQPKPHSFITFPTMSPNMSTIFPNICCSSPISFTLQYAKGYKQLLHPLQLQAYVNYNQHLHKGKFDTPKPLRYHEFAEAINTSGASKPHCFVTYDAFNHLWIPNRSPVTLIILPIPFHNPNTPI